MITKELKRYTTEDYKRLVEGDPHQLINGDLIMREASPTYGHQGLLRDVFMQIVNHLRDNPVGEALCAPIDVYLDEHNVLQPDIVFVANDGSAIARKDGFHGAPDMIIEILSPSTSYYDLTVKKGIYEKHGVREYWIIDPSDGTVIGFKYIDGNFHEFFTGKDVFSSEVLNIEISLTLE